MNQYFLQMLAGVYLEPELFLLWRIDQSFITLILRIGPKLASFKNVVLKYELKKKKKAKQTLKTKKHRQLFLPNTPQNPRFVVDELEDEYHLNTWKSVYSLISDSVVLPAVFSSSQGQQQQTE